jgi:hypothetical protein
MQILKLCFITWDNTMDTSQIIAMFDTKEAANRILLKTDWTQLPDNGLTDACVALFATYRASIRTIRQTTPANPTWPDVPTEEWS